MAFSQVLLSAYGTFGLHVREAPARMYSLMDVRAMLRPPGSGWLQFLPRLCLLGSGESAASNRSLVPQSVETA